MEEARDVLQRLARIGALRDEGAPAAVVLIEVRDLLAAAERWSALDGDQRSEEALERCRAALGPDPERDRASPRDRAPLVPLRAGGGAWPEGIVLSTDP